MKDVILTPKSLEDYNKSFIKILPDFNILDEFFSNVINLIDPAGNSTALTSIKQNLDKVSFESTEQIEILYSDFIGFTNSVIGLIEVIENTPDTDKRVKLLNDIFEKFIAIYKNDYPKICSIVLENGNFLMSQVWDIYQLPQQTSIQKIKLAAEKKLGKQITDVFFYFVAQLKETEDAEEVDFLRLQNLFFFLVTLCSILDMHRKLELSKKNDDYNSMKIVNRNDPCPCGSGKKYKKCCMLKIK